MPVARTVERKHVGQDMKAVYKKKPILYKFIKRAFDIISSGIALILLLPLFAVVAILIKKEDGGPVFFTARRYGKDMKRFPMHKFRSMCVNAEEKLKEVLKEEDKNGMAYKIDNDPRITKIGNFLRRTSIDELPQLWNVFKGEMSIVGPRPIGTTDMEEDPYDMQRYTVRPGLTCIWQVSGRVDVPWDEWVEMDLDYIENMSILLDIKLIWQTFSVVVAQDGSR